MKRATRRCSRPGCYETAGPSGYCPVDAAKQERAMRRTTPTKRARTTEVRKHRATTILDYLEANNGVALCPGWDRPPHEVAPEDLTADDVVPISKGGDPMQPLRVLCRPCNSRRGNRPDPA